jgi:DNA-directed RNA polymerase subunit RPC12/RpoP
MLMADKNFVCSVCSQTFTRMWRGKVHNNNLHAGQSQIVRLIDYMVGRLNGLYLPSNPSDFRKKNSSFLPTHPQGTASASKQPRHTQEAIIKTAKLKEILDRYFPPSEVQQILWTASYQCSRCGDNRPLDDAIREFGKADEVRKATEYLRKS